MKPVPSSVTYGSTSKSPVVSLVMEEELVKMITDMQSSFTKSETVYENDQVSVVRIVDPLVNLYRGEMIVNEMFVATLTQMGFTSTPSLPVRFTIAPTRSRTIGKSARRWSSALKRIGVFVSERIRAKKGGCPASRDPPFFLPVWSLPNRKSLVEERP